MMTRKKSDEIPVWKRDNLTIEEAAAYTGVGMTKLRELSDADSCDFVLWVETRETGPFFGQRIFNLSGLQEKMR